MECEKGGSEEDQIKIRLALLESRKGTLPKKKIERERI